MADVAVVLSNYDAADVLPACLASIAAQTLRPSAVVVVDAGSRDAGVELARAHGVRVIDAENRGLGHLYNTGVRAVEAELVLVANSDVALEPDCLERLAAALEAEPARFAADPTQLDWDGSRVIHARTVVSRGPLLRTPVPGLDVDAVVPADAVVEIPFANAGAMLVRRARLLELGGFDEAMFMDHEDLDLGWRAWLRGWPSVHVPDAVVRHKVGVSTTASARPRRLRSSHYNLVRFALKCLPAGAAARVVAGELLRLPRHPRPVAAALARIARDLPGILRARRALQPRRDVYARLVAGAAPRGGAGYVVAALWLLLAAGLFVVQLARRASGLG